MNRISSLPSLLVIVLSLLCLAAQAAEPDDYRLKANDMISMIIYEHDDLTSKVQLTAAGEASFQLIGAIKLGGKTLLEAEGVIGSVADFHYSFMGASSSEVMESYARELAALLKKDKVDGVVLAPV